MGLVTWASLTLDSWNLLMFSYFSSTTILLNLSEFAPFTLSHTHTTAALSFPSYLFGISVCVCVFFCFCFCFFFYVTFFSCWVGEGVRLSSINIRCLRGYIVKFRGALVNKTWWWCHFWLFSQQGLYLIVHLGFRDLPFNYILFLLLWWLNCPFCLCFHFSVL